MLLRGVTVCDASPRLHLRHRHIFAAHLHLDTALEIGLCEPVSSMSCAALRRDR